MFINYLPNTCFYILFSEIYKLQSRGKHGKCVGAGPHADIWALGVSFYLATTGVHPFGIDSTTDNDEEALAKAAAPLKFLSEVRKIIFRKIFHGIFFFLKGKQLNFDHPELKYLLRVFINFEKKI
jgi:serine/threonine protein kinase